MSLRDHFAGQAIQGWLGCSAIVYYFNHGQTSGSLESVADDAYRLADAMLEARQRPTRSRLLVTAENLVAFWDAQPDENLSVVERDELTQLESELREAVKAVGFNEAGESVRRAPLGRAQSEDDQ